MKNDSDEIRCGYTVTKNRKALWNIELTILEWFIHTSRLIGLKYFLIGGSEIGVLRHHGFIPWDDDIDVGMLRADYDKFLQYCKEHGSSPYDVQEGYSDSTGQLSRITRIRDKRTTGIIFNEVSTTDTNKGVFIEVYPYDSVPNSRRMRAVHARFLIALQKLMSFKSSNHAARWKRIGASFANRLISNKQLSALSQAMSCMFSGRKTHYVAITVLPYYYQSGSEILPRRFVEEVRVESFENLQVCIPKFAEESLKIQYGDYMRLPPINKRGKNHQNIVFYDPNRPYQYYSGQGDLEALFSKFGNLLDQND